MRYYQIKDEYNNKNVYDTKGAHKEYMGFVIGGELFTPGEMLKRSIPYKWAREVSVKKTDTYKFFGVRKPVEGAEVLVLRK